MDVVYIPRAQSRKPSVGALLLSYHPSSDRGLGVPRLVCSLSYFFQSLRARFSALGERLGDVTKPSPVTLRLCIMLSPEADRGRSSLLSLSSMLSALDFFFFFF